MLSSIGLVFFETVTQRDLVVIWLSALKYLINGFFIQLKQFSILNNSFRSEGINP